MHSNQSQTPNFALDKADVPKATPVRVPGESELDIPSDDGPRYTVHLLPDFAKTLQRIAPSGASVWFPATMEEDHSPPSTLLLDFWYGCVALRAWGQDAFRSYCMDEIFGPEGRTVQHPSVNSDNNEKSSDDASVEMKRACQRTMKGLAGTNMDDILDDMLAFSKKRQLYHQEVAKKGEDETQRHLRVMKIEEDEKQETPMDVNDWLRCGPKTEHFVEQS